MADRETAEEKLARLRELIVNARAMPMSASCVINRGEVLAAIDDVIDNLPDEIADAQRSSTAPRPRSPRARPRPAGSWPRPASTRRAWPSTARSSGSPRSRRDKIRADAEARPAALRRETDEFIDSRMASFESVLHKTASQVQTARFRLAERSGLDRQSDRSTSISRPTPTGWVWSLGGDPGKVGTSVMTTIRPLGLEGLR